MSFFSGLHFKNKFLATTKPDSDDLRSQLTKQDWTVKGDKDTYTLEPVG
jgi:hypothetical protein